MNPRALLAAIIIGLLACSPSTVHAAEGAPKIGYVDVKAVATRSTSIQSSVKDAEGKLKGKQDQIEIHVREFRDAKKDLDTQRSVMAEDEVRKQEKKLQELRDKVEGMQMEIDKELRRTESEVMGPAVDRIIATVKRLGKDQGFDLVLTNDIVIYGSETLDLTPLVIQDLDSAAAKGADSATKPASAQPEKAEKAEKPPEKPKEPAAPAKPKSKGKK